MINNKIIKIYFENMIVFNNSNPIPEDKGSIDTGDLQFFSCSLGLC